MRPRKEVLLVMPNEFERSLWALRLEIWGYRVSGYATVDEALEHLRTFPVDGCATNRRSAAKVLNGRMSEVLLFGLKPTAENFTLTRFVPESPEIAAGVRDALYRMMARKCRPKPGFKDAAEKKPVQGAVVEELVAKRRA